MRAATGGGESGGGGGISYRGRHEQGQDGSQNRGSGGGKNRKRFNRSTITKKSLFVEVNIPGTACGAIIGQKGQTIKTIESVTLAKVQAPPVGRDLPMRIFATSETHALHALLQVVQRAAVVVPEMRSSADSQSTGTPCIMHLPAPEQGGSAQGERVAGRAFPLPATLHGGTLFLQEDGGMQDGGTCEGTVSAQPTRYSAHCLAWSAPAGGPWESEEEAEEAAREILKGVRDDVAFTTGVSEAPVQICIRPDWMAPTGWILFISYTATSHQVLKDTLKALFEKWSPPSSLFPALGSILNSDQKVSAYINALELCQTST